MRSRKEWPGIPSGFFLLLLFVVPLPIPPPPQRCPGNQAAWQWRTLVVLAWPYLVHGLAACKALLWPRYLNPSKNYAKTPSFA